MLQNTLCRSGLPDSGGGDGDAGDDSQSDVEDDGADVDANGTRRRHSGSVGGGNHQTVSFGGTYIQGDSSGDSPIVGHHTYHTPGRSRGGSNAHQSSGLRSPQSSRSPPSLQTSREEDDDSSNADCRSPGQRLA